MKLYLKILIFQFLIFNAQLFAQYGDCDNMLVLNDTIFHAKNISGYGNKKEFDGNELENNKVFESEKNTIWYLITVTSTGKFTFDIETKNDADDWDFLLYEYKKMFCKRIDAKKIEPIRTNLSRSPITGLSLTAKENFVGAGINENYSKYLNVKKGEKYVLVVNNPKQSNGSHTLKLHFPKIKMQQPIEVVKPVENTTTTFHLNVKDKESMDSVQANFNISGLTNDDVFVKHQAAYEITLPKKNRTITIDASAKGYMLSSTEVKISANKTITNYDLLLDPITVGAKVNLTKIQFYGNRYDLLPTAKPVLKSLLLFMESNPNVVIQIEGHVNGPGKRNSKSYQELSYNRAYAVKYYLVENGIDKERIDFKGYGNSKMLYPNPKSEYQEAANRRVEIKIIAK